jgi:hypothetical protein
MGLKSNLLALSGLAVRASAFNLSFPSGDYCSDLSITNAPSATCDFFKQNYPNMTVLPTDANYTAENEDEFLKLCFKHFVH